MKVTVVAIGPVTERWSGRSMIRAHLARLFFTVIFILHIIFYIFRVRTPGTTILSVRLVLERRGGSRKFEMGVRNYRYACMGGARVKCVGRSNENYYYCLKSASTNKTVKRFQMKSTGCRDVQHTGLQSTQTRMNYSSNNTGKQGAQTRGIFEFPSIPTSVAA